MRSVRKLNQALVGIFSAQQFAWTYLKLYIRFINTVVREDATYLSAVSLISFFKKRCSVINLYTLWGPLLVIRFELMSFWVTKGISKLFVKKIFFRVTRLFSNNCLLSYIPFCVSHTFPSVFQIAYYQAVLSELNIIDFGHFETFFPYHFKLTTKT